MKKAAIIIGILAAAAVMFALSLVVLVRLRGGPSAGYDALGGVPLIGGMLKAGAGPQPQPAEQQAEPAHQLAARRQMPFLSFGPESRLEYLAEELSVKSADYDGALRRLERRSRELDAWERQLKEERDILRARFGKEKRELTALKDELARTEAALAARRILIDASEEANLKKTAEIYGKMAAASAAQVLTEMYGSGQQETVVKIVYLMQDRSAAKMLEAMTDPKMTAQITEQLKLVGKEVEQGG